MREAPAPAKASAQTRSDISYVLGIFRKILNFPAATSGLGGYHMRLNRFSILTGFQFCAPGCHVHVSLNYGTFGAEGGKK